MVPRALKSVAIRACRSVGWTKLRQRNPVARGRRRGRRRPKGSQLCLPGARPLGSGHGRRLWSRGRSRSRCRHRLQRRPGLHWRGCSAARMAAPHRARAVMEGMRVLQPTRSAAAIHDGRGTMATISSDATSKKNTHGTGLFAVCGRIRFWSAFMSSCVVCTRWLRPHPSSSSWSAW